MQPPSRALSSVVSFIPFQTGTTLPVRPIIRYPDPLLKTESRAVAEFDDALKQLATDLLDTMRAAPGVGITGPHVGVLQRIAVIELNRQDGVHVYVNPEVLWSSADVAINTEGSVSMPGATEDVSRPISIRFRYQDLEGTSREEEASGFLATCIQHEIDQLDGVFWLQRLSKLKRDRLIRKWEKRRN
jgi:peptide deformylase